MPTKMAERTEIRLTAAQLTAFPGWGNEDGAVLLKGLGSSDANHTKK